VVGGADETILNVLTDGGGKEYWLLRYETYLGSEPLQIQFTNVDAVQAHGPSEGIIEPLDKRDDSRFARSRSTYECCSLACRERKAEVLNDLNIRARGVVEVNVLEVNFANDLARLEAFLAGRINGRHLIDGGIEFRCGPERISNSCGTRE
jgi:hypothetical protein